MSSSLESPGRTCQEYEKLIEKWLSALQGQQFFVIQSASRRKRSLVESLRFEWNVTRLRWKARKIHAALLPHCQNCKVCQEIWHKRYEEMVQKFQPRTELSFPSRAARVASST
jgi:hypothetical protein